MSFASSGGAPVVRIIDGQAVEFPALTRGELGRLCARWAAEDSAEYAGILDAAGIAGAAKAAALWSHVCEQRTWWAAVNSLRRIDRATETVEASTGGPCKLSPDETIAVAVELWGIAPRSPGEPSDPK